VLDHRALDQRGVGRHQPQGLGLVKQNKRY
jgi:hypothetical protein